MFELHVVPVTGEATAVAPGTGRTGPSDRFLVYRPLAGLALVGNRGLAELAVTASRGVPVDEAGEAAAFLAGIGFLAPDPPPGAQPADDRAPTTAALLLTNRCQLRCTYCYAAAGESATEVMDPEVGRAVIDYVHDAAEAADRPWFELAMHGGGEPTWPAAPLRVLAEYARSRRLPARLTLTSNAVWSRRQLEWIVDTVDGLTVSVDGAPATQDAQRPFPGGRGSSAVVLRNLADLDARGYPYAIRVTATPPWDRLADDVGFLFDATACQAVQVEPAFNAARGGRPTPADEQCSSFARAFRAALHLAEGAGRELTFSGAPVGAVAGSFCSAPYDTLVATTRGELVTCYEVTAPTHPLFALSAVGRVSAGRVVVDEDARDGLWARLAERREACLACWCRWTCAGDCYARAFDPATRRGHLSFGPRCTMIREITRAVLLARIARHGVWRAGTPRRCLPVEEPCS